MPRKEESSVDEGSVSHGESPHDLVFSSEVREWGGSTPHEDVPHSEARTSVCKAATSSKGNVCL